MQEEILDVERLLIANGETPSVFFRFPGLISDPALMEAVRENHLIPLGANAWLALGRKAPPGAVVLVHPNGNEPFGSAFSNICVAKARCRSPSARSTKRHEINERTTGAASTT